MSTEINRSGKIHFGYVVFIACCLIALTGLGIVTNTMSTFLSQVNEETGIPYTTISLYFTFKTLTMLVMQPICTRLFHKYNVKMVVGVSVVVSCAAMAMTCLFTQGWHFWIGGVIDGAGTSVLTFLMVPTLINNWFAARVGFFLGIASCMTNLGGAIFSPIAGRLIASIGWRPAILIMAAIALVVSLPAALLGLRLHPSELGLEKVGMAELRRATGSDNPASQQGNTLKEAFRSPYLYLICGLVVCMYFVAQFQSQLTKFAQANGFPIESAAVVASMLMVGSVVGKLLLGYIHDRAGLVACVSLGAGGGIVGTILLIMARGGTTMTFLGAFFFGIAFALISVTPPLFVKRAFGAKYMGLIYGSFVVCFGSLTSSISAPIYGAIYDTTQNYYPSLYMCVGFLVAAVVLTIIIYSGTRHVWGNDQKLRR